MRMILHGVAHDVGDFVESAVVEGLHGVQYSALHGFKPVFYVGDGAFENNVAGIFEIPVAKHSGKHGAFADRFF